MSNDTIARLEADIKRAKRVVEMGESLERLQTNRDFRQLILEGYFEKEAIRLVHLKADPSMQTVPMQDSIMKQIDAIGALHTYLLVVDLQAEQARKAIEGIDETIEEIVTEEAA